MDQDQENTNVGTTGADQEASKQAKKTKSSGSGVATKIVNKATKFKNWIKYLPIIGKILLILIAILVIVGIITLFSTLPGVYIENIKEFGISLWGNIVGVFSGDNITTTVTKEDQINLAQRIQDMGYDIVGYGFADAKYELDDEPNSEEIDGFTNGTIKDITPLANSKNYLQTYIAQSEATYVLSTWSFLGALRSIGSNINNAFSQVENWLFGESNQIIEENDARAFSKGMLNVNIPEDDEYNINIKVDRENKLLQMRIKRAGLVNIFSRGKLYYFDLSDWTSVYGKPLELFLALHISTMMPDLAYELASADCFNTKVNIDLQEVKSTFKVIIKTADGQELQQEEIIISYLHYICGIPIEFINRCIEAGKLNELFLHVMNNISDISLELINLQDGGTYDTTQSPTGTHGAINLSQLERELLGVEEGEETYKIRDVEVIIQSEPASDYSGVEEVEVTRTEDMDRYISIPDFDNESERQTAEAALPSTNLSGFTIEQIIEITQLMLDGATEATTYLPRISSVTKHWFYNDIVFEYGTAGKAKRKVQFETENEDDPLSEANLNGASIILDTTYTNATGVLYQLAEPEATGPNEAIIALFKGGSGIFDGESYNFPGEYYRYDGTRDTALKIANAKARDANKTEFTFQGETHPVDSSQNSTLNISKQQVSFATEDEDGNQTFNDAYSAFSILENVHSLEAETVYRQFKELLINLEYFSREDFLKPLNQVLLWPVERVGSSTEEYDDNAENVIKGIYRNENEYGLFLDNGTAVNSGDRIIAPGDATVVKVEGDSITFKFKTISDGQAQALEAKFGEDYSSIDKNIVLDMEMTIKGINSSVSVGQEVTAGTPIGSATSDDIRIIMYNVDKSYVEDIETYMYPTYEGTRQVIIL